MTGSARPRSSDGSLRLAVFALMVVCFVDVMGQGLAFPIFDTLLLKSGSGFLPVATSRSQAELLYSIAIGTFFLTWLFGSIYVARLSDSIGRKRGILICLVGAFAGYALAAAAIPLRSYPLLVASRAITGFTAGTQPIAAAAMIDLARSEAESTRNLGLVNVGVSGGLVIGPIIGGVFSDPAILGPWASPTLPFMVGGGLCLVALVFVALSFRDARQALAPLRLSPLEVGQLLGRGLQRRAVRRVTAVFFPYMLCFMGFYVFAAASLTARFGYGTQAASLAMFLLGTGLALASGLLVEPLNARLSSGALLGWVALLLCAVIAAFVAVPSGPLALALLLPAGALHGIGYPTLLAAYSRSASAEEQGWVMGFSTAVFTLAAASVSFLGGELTASGPAAPFLFALACGAAAWLAIQTIWRPERWPGGAHP
ncbi:MFS transporter [Synechococcus sp. CBW1002]|uniref:MFS transporter n=1 Tax=Synechococcus sp. CBW1002 TaxID=1353134 RepID=UPI001E2CEC6A|nr:MFS transporter [Synechococcus sp. CBW1002]